MHALRLLHHEGTLEPLSERIDKFVREAPNQSVDRMRSIEIENARLEKRIVCV